MTPGFLVFEIYELVGLVLLGTPNGVPAPRSWTFLDEGGPHAVYSAHFGEGRGLGGHVPQSHVIWRTVQGPHSDFLTLGSKNMRDTVVILPTRIF